MPTYVYECQSCSEQTELLQRVSDPPLESCPECGEKVRKLLFPPGIVFKGSGFHINDYRKPEDKKKDSEPSSTSPDTSPKSETKSESTTSAK